VLHPIKLAYLHVIIDVLSPTVQPSQMTSIPMYACVLPQATQRTVGS
jgi:hypothetical protein